MQWRSSWIFVCLFLTSICLYSMVSSFSLSPHYPLSENKKKKINIRSFQLVENNTFFQSSKRKLIVKSNYNDSDKSKEGNSSNSNVLASSSSSSSSAVPILNDGKAKKSSFYKRPAKAVEMGGGFFIPGLEGYRLRLFTSVLVFLLLVLNRFPGYEISLSQWQSEVIGFTAAITLLGQALVEKVAEEALQKAAIRKSEASLQVSTEYVQLDENSNTEDMIDLQNSVSDLEKSDQIIRNVSSYNEDLERIDDNTKILDGSERSDNILWSGYAILEGTPARYMAIIDREKGWIYSRGYEERMIQNNKQREDNDLNSLFDRKIWSLPICKFISSVITDSIDKEEQTKEKTSLINTENNQINQIKRIFIKNLDDALYEKLKVWLLENNLVDKEMSKSVLIYRIERDKTKENQNNDKIERDQIVVIGSDLTNPYNERDINLIESTLRLSVL